jgi:1-acyl-sn-glycerol-3-phosphate acyltransferase
LVCGAIIPNFVKYLGKAEILNYPVLGFFLKHYNIPVKRDDKDNRNWSMEQMKDKLKTGCSMFICPEGICNTTKNFFKEFRDGAFRLAIDVQLPIVPLTLIHTGELMPRSQFLLRPGKVILYYHEPLPVEGLNSGDVAALKEKVITIMHNDILEHYPKGSY